MSFTQREPLWVISILASEFLFAHETILGLAKCFTSVESFRLFTKWSVAPESIKNFTLDLEPTVKHLEIREDLITDANDLVPLSLWSSRRLGLGLR